MNTPEMTSSSRVVIGNCPHCGVVIAAATNAGQAWPLLKCHHCLGNFPTSDLWNHHYFERTRAAALTIEAPQPCPQGRYPFAP